MKNRLDLVVIARGGALDFSRTSGAKSTKRDNNVITDAQDQFSGNSCKASMQLVSDRINAIEIMILESPIEKHPLEEASEGCIRENKRYIFKYLGFLCEFKHAQVRSGVLQQNNLLLFLRMDSTFIFFSSNLPLYRIAPITGSWIAQI